MPLVLEQDVVISLTPEARRDLEVKVVYDGPIPAPVVKGARVAELEIVAPGIEPRRLPLIAERGGPGSQPLEPGDQRARLSDLGAVVMRDAGDHGARRSALGGPIWAPP